MYTQIVKAPRLSEDSALCTEEASAADVLNQAVGVISRRLHTMDVCTNLISSFTNYVDISEYAM